MGMSFVPQMQNYFGKNTDFTKLSSAYGDSNAFGVQADMQGDLIREQAKNRAEMRLMAGEHALSQGKAAGRSATTGGILSGIGSLAGGFLQGGFGKGGFLTGGSGPGKMATLDSTPMTVENSYGSSVSYYDPNIYSGVGDW